MLALIRYKYLSGRRNNAAPFFVWSVVFVSALFLCLLAFAVAFGLSQGHHLALADLEVWLLAVGVLLIDVNVGRQTPLNLALAREWEFLTTLPLSPVSIAVVELFEWLLTSVLCVLAFLIAPLTACMLTSSTPFPLTLQAQAALLLYCLFIMLAGAALHLLSLRGEGYVVIPIRLASLVCIVMIVALSPLERSGIQPGLVAALRWQVVRLVALWLWPSTWAVESMRGALIFWLLLAGATALLAWVTVPGLLRYWQQKERVPRRPSGYLLRWLPSSGWSLACWLSLDMFFSPHLRFLPSILSLNISIVPIWYLFHLSNQEFWLASILLVSARLGWPIYLYLQNVYRTLEGEGLPLAPTAGLRAFAVAFALVYLPSIIVALIICLVAAPSLGLLPGFLLGLAGVLALACCAWSGVPRLGGFLALALIELLAALCM
jgi:hypothetical protein